MTKKLRSDLNSLPILRMGSVFIGDLLEQEAVSSFDREVISFEDFAFLLAQAKAGDRLLLALKVMLTRFSI